MWEQAWAVLSLPLLAGVSNPKPPQNRERQGPGGEHVTFSIVTSLVTSYTTQTTLACKREEERGMSEGPGAPAVVGRQV